MRRRLHRMPEIGLEEYKTADLHRGAARQHYGIEPARITATGVTALIEGARAGPDRHAASDIDALPVTEETGTTMSPTSPA